MQQYKFRELGTLTFSLYLSQIPTVTACLVSSPSFCGKVKEEAEKKSCTVPVVLTQINFIQIWDFCFLQIWAAQANAFLIGRSATSANSLFSSVFLTACFFWTLCVSFLWISKEKDWIEMARSKPKSPLCSLNQKGLVPSPIHPRQPAESPGRITHKIKAK